MACAVDAAGLARAVNVDVKTVSRWLDGRVPHQRTRLLVAAQLGEELANLWPTSRPDVAPGSETTSEVLGAQAHRADVPTQLWTGLIANAKDRVDLLGYSFPFLLESSPDTVQSLARRCDDGLRVRIAVADRDCAHVLERDHAGRVLLQQRSDSGNWSMPGGIMEIGETLAQTATREVREETGLDIEITGLLGIYTDPQHIIAYSDGEVRQEFEFAYTARVVGGTLAASDESDEVRFIDPADLDTIRMHGSTRLRLAHWHEATTPFLG